MLQHTGHLIDVLGQFTRIHRHGAAVPGQAHLGGDRPDRGGVVSRDDAAAHTLVTEPGQRLLGIGADAFRADHQRHRPGLREQPRLVRQRRLLGPIGPHRRLHAVGGKMRHQQDTVAVGGVGVGLAQDIGVVAVQRRQDDLRRAHVPQPSGHGERRRLARLARGRADQPVPLLGVGDGTPFAGRGERDARLDAGGHVSPLPQRLKDRPAGAVGLLLVGQVVQRLQYAVLLRMSGGLIRARGRRISIQHDQTVERDAAVGDGAGLVQVQTVHAGERLHRFEFLHQRVLARQADCGEREVQRGEQHQAFGDHAHHARHGRDDGLAPFAGGDGHAPSADGVDLRPDEQRAQGHDQEGHEFQDGVDALVQVGDGFLVDLGLGGQRGRVAVLAHGVDANERHAGHRGGPRVDLVPLGFADRARLAGQHRLVELQPPAFDDLRVRRHLLAGTDPHDVVEHDLVVRHLDVPALAAHQEVRRHQDRELVQGALGAQLGDDADAGVDDDDEAEHRVTPGPGNQHQHHGRQDDAVEQGEDVGPDDLRQRTRRGILDLVGPPGFHTGLDLGTAQAALGGGGHGGGVIGCAHVILCVSCVQRSLSIIGRSRPAMVHIYPDSSLSVPRPPSSAGVMSRCVSRRPTC